MRVQIQSAGDREVHVVHLGDVYYAGTRWAAATVRYVDMDGMLWREPDTL
jgi:hypothetical protein